MALLRLTSALLATFGLIWALHTSFPVKGANLPPLGDFLNPFTGLWQNSEPKTGFLPIGAKIAGLKGAVKVAYDDRRVPHIFAENAEDAAMVQGFVHAQNRLFQMDLSSRRGAGRLSEVLGERTIRADQNAKHIGLLTASQNMLETWKQSKEDWPIIEAYTAGVNAFLATIDEKSLPVEYKLLGFLPEKWTPLKSAICAKNMAESLSMREEDTEMSNTVAAFGEATARELFPDFDPKQVPIMPDNGQWKGIKPDLSKRVLTTNPANSSPESMGLLEKNAPIVPIEAVTSSHRLNVPQDFCEKQPSGIGSNNWAFSGKKTRSGNPILCNDPHLILSLPSTWFEVQINANGTNAYGVSLPGCPGIVIGFNEKIAWGQTNTGYDVLDWYTIKWADGAHTQYILDGQPRSVELKTDTIFVKNRKEPIIETVKWTVWGPIASEEPGDLHRDQAMRWLPIDRPDVCIMATFRKLMAGKNIDDYVEAMKSFDSPSQNYVFASADGDIAIRPTGKTPIKSPGQGRRAQDGSLSNNNWKGFIPFHEMPFQKNPSRGWVGSANQNPAPPSYPYFLWGADFEHFRSRRLHELAEKIDSATADDMKAIQNDIYSVKAADALPAMLKLLNINELSAAEKTAADQLAAWDFNFSAEKTEPTLFSMWYDQFYHETWDEFFTKIEADKKELATPEDWRFIQFLQRDTTSKWFDLAATPDRENARAIANLSFKKIVAEAALKLVTGELAFYKFKGTSIRHIGRVPGFGLKNVKVGGQRGILNAVTPIAGPSWRMIVELSPDGPVAQAVIPGGTSGNPGSPNYLSGVDEWTRGEYFKLNFLKKIEDAGATAVVQEFSK